VWLVEEQQARPAHQRDGNGQPTTLPGGQLAVDRVDEWTQTELVEDATLVGIVDRRGTRTEPQVFTNGEVVVTPGLVSYQADHPAVPTTVGVEVLTQHLGRPRVERHKPGEQT
jgi:hypothetical protein